ncbi:MAG: hypothetical protein IPM57_05350 [Oligoflexia bacterium]|nr:hypothetical protein [Oligoflexia bacterium]
MTKFARSSKSAIFLCSLFFLNGCATYPFQTQNAQSAIYAGDFDRAAQLLEEKAKQEGKDQLLYLFDRGVALQLAGRYKESSQNWLLADKLSEVKDYVSLSQEAASIILNDNLKEYKGEDFEKVIINGLLAINYVMEGNFEEALVECRRLNRKLYLYKTLSLKDYEQNPFARYLSAMIWEASSKLEDAYIDYKETHKLTPNYPYLKFDLIRLAKKLGREQDLKKWHAEYGEQIEIPNTKKKTELILIYQQGKSAVKRTHPESHRFPKFYARFSTGQSAKVEVDGLIEQTQKIYSISDVAIKNLDDAYAGMVAKKMAGIVAKEVIADQVRQKDETLGFLVWLGLHASDQADLRHWATLPESIQFARLLINPGENKTIKVSALDSGGQPTGEEKIFIIDKAKAGKKIFLNWRSFR